MPPPPSETPHLLARQMFFVGCLGLPWLWCVNFLYFRKQVYGPIFPWDNNDDDDDVDDQFGDIMNLGGAMSEDTSDGEGDTDDNTGYEDGAFQEKNSYNKGGYSPIPRGARAMLSENPTSVLEQTCCIVSYFFLNFPHLLCLLFSSFGGSSLYGTLP